MFGIDGDGYGPERDENGSFVGCRGHVYVRSFGDESQLYHGHADGGGRSDDDDFLSFGEGFSESMEALVGGKVYAGETDEIAGVHFFVDFDGMVFDHFDVASVSSQGLVEASDAVAHLEVVDFVADAYDASDAVASRYVREGNLVPPGGPYVSSLEAVVQADGGCLHLDENFSIPTNGFVHVPIEFHDSGRSIFGILHEGMIVFVPFHFLHIAMLSPLSGHHLLRFFLAQFPLWSSIPGFLGFG
mmetsp:Transcript_41549/g.97239  ORF Transcript_41549/g.97239 Transcript_41549/m.97239 type:complete len:244 (-) Transcript_41549:86-817(-)